RPVPASPYFQFPGKLFRVGDCRSTMAHMTPTATRPRKSSASSASSSASLSSLSLRTHPHLFQINTWLWLDELSRAHGKAVTLGSVPDAEWDRVAGYGMDLVYLMGVWDRSI